MQLLSSFDRGMRVEKTLTQTLVSHQLSSSFEQGFSIIHFVCLGQRGGQEEKEKGKEEKEKRQIPTLGHLRRLCCGLLCKSRVGDIHCVLWFDFW